MNPRPKLAWLAACAVISASAAASPTVRSALPGPGQPLAAVPLVRGDLDFLLDAARTAAMEIEAARVATRRSVDPHVRAFAEDLIQDYTKALRQLQEIAQEKTVAMPTRPTRQQDYDVDTLRGLSGETLDQEFLKRIGIDAHRQALARAHVQATTLGRDTDLARFAQDRLPLLQQHLRKAKALYGANQALAEARESAPSGSADGPHAQVREAVQVVHAMQGDPETADLLKRAYGVFILPKYARAALGVGLQGGTGVLMARHEGSFTTPAFYRLSGVSVGAQAGVAAGEVALLLMTPRAVQQFMSDSRFSMNFDLALTVGEYTGREQASAGKIEDIVLWSGTQGAYAGLSFGVTVVTPDESANEAYYGRPDITPLEILGGRVVDPRNNILSMVLNA